MGIKSYTHVVENVDDNEDTHPCIELAKEFLLEPFPCLCSTKFLVTGDGDLAFEDIEVV